MGKALVIAGTIVIAAILGVALAAWWRRQVAKERAAEKGWAIKGDLTEAQERHLKAHLDAAAVIMRRVATPTIDLNEETSLLTPGHRAEVEAWLRTYNDKKRDPK